MTRDARRFALAARRLAAVAVLVGVASYCGAAGQRATEDPAVAALLQAEENLNRLRLESELCLDAGGPEKVLRDMGSSEPCEWMDEAGDPSFGVLQFIGQIHEARVETSESEDEATVLYQLAILRYLLARHARTVFFEGAAAGVPLALEDSTAARLRRVFSNIDSVHGFGQIDDHQFLLLRRGFLPFVFSSLRPSARVLGADDTSASGQLSRDQAQMGYFEIDSLMMEHRERVAMKAVCRHFVNHPGDTAWLVFGVAHTFDASIVPEGLPTPRIHDVVFPGLSAIHPVTQPQVIHFLGGTPGFVPRYLERLDYLNPACFAELSEADQLHALRKPFLLTAEIADEDSLDRYLTREAKSGKVRQAIARGPIAHLPRD